ncbi:MAG TPA: NDP-sugar synthase [Acidimicrobiales bacterium]|nr:NDP-sugar synthase [Acidimicrobiales bacterium]
MKAVVLVGGEGTRLRPLTYAIPKQMLPVAGVTMIERVLAQLARHGVDEVVLSMGYRPDAFLAAFGDGTAAGVRLTYAVEPEPLDTGGAIAFAARAAGIDDTFLAVNGDVLSDMDISAVVGFHRGRGAQATIALTPVEDPSAFGVVPTDADGRVEAFIEKPAPGTAPTNLINAGTYVLEPAVLDGIAEGRRVSVERETFPALVELGALYAFPADEYWLDTGTPAQYLRANLDIVAGRRPDCLPPVAGAHQDSTGVWLAAGATRQGAVEGPCLLGAGSVVEEGAAVSSSVLGEGVVVESGAKVSGSVLLDGCRVAQDAAVDGAVIGRGATVGRGAAITPVTVVACDAEVAEGAELADARYPTP